MIQIAALLKQQPGRPYQKLTPEPLVQGDFILFKRGETWRGTIGCAKFRFSRQSDKPLGRREWREAGDKLGPMSMLHDF